MKTIIEDKNMFRNGIAQTLSIIKMNYIFKTIKKINNGRATVLDPGRFEDKKKLLEVLDKKKA